MGRCIRLRVPLLVLCIALVADGWFYNITKPNITAGCSPRCADTGGLVRWRCDPVEGDLTVAKTCDTIVLKSGKKNCHFHMHSRQETAACLTSSKQDIILIGGSYLTSMSVGVFSWFNSSVISTPSFSPMHFFNLVNWVDPTQTIYRIKASEIGLSKNATMLYRTGFVEETNASLSAELQKNVLSFGPQRNHTNWYTKLTFARDRTWLQANQTLDLLKGIGRNNTRAALLINMGYWTFYCYRFNWCDTGDGFAATHRTDPAAILANYEAQMIAFCKRVKGEFPLFDMYFMDNFAGGDEPYDFVSKLISITATVGSEYGEYINFSDMVYASNGVNIMDNHPLHIYSFWTFNRVLSKVCADYSSRLPLEEVECEEEVVFSDGCKTPTGAAQRWDVVNTRACDFKAFASYNRSQNTPITFNSTADDDYVDSLIWYTSYNVSMYSDGIFLDTTALQFSLTNFGSSNVSLGTKDTITRGLLVIFSVLVITRELIKGRQHSRRELQDKPSDPASRKKPSKPSARDEASGGAPFASEKHSSTALQTQQTAHDCKIDDIEEDKSRSSHSVSKDETTMHAEAELCLVIPKETSPQVQTHPRPASETWGYLDSLDAARYLASLHVVMGHLSRLSPNPLPHEYVFIWGFTWVPWFMMLSAFVLTYSSLRRDSLNASQATSRQSPGQFLFRRVSSIYPLYLIGLLCAFFVAVSRNTWQQYADWTLIGSSLTLTQAWLPSITEHVLQNHCWFLSCIVPYWYFHDRLVRMVASLSSFQLLFLTATLAAWGWLVVILPHVAGFSDDWYSQHSWGGTNKGVDILVIMLKFHPLFYLHVYVFGIAIAFLFKQYQSKPPLLLQYGASIGYAGLLVVFLFSDAQLPAYKLSARLGALAPLHGLLLIGLAFGVDPISRLFATWPFRTIGQYSYSQYVFQFIAYDSWNAVVDFSFVLFLCAMAICGKHVADTLGAKDDKRFLRSCKWVATIFFAGILLWGSLPKDQIWDMFYSHSSSASTCSPYVEYTDGSFDVRLNLSSTGVLDNVKAHTVINPSLLLHNNQMYAAARRHRKVTSISTDEKLGNKLLTVTTWHADIVFGTIDPSSLAMTENPLVHLSVVTANNHSAWAPCAQTPEYHAENDSYTQVVVTGPQDPRFVVVQGRVRLTFFSTIPYLNACPSNGTIGTMYITDPVDKLTSATVTAFPLTPASGTTFEKNWMAFSVGNTQEGTFFIRHVSPFTVVDFMQEEDEVTIQDYSSLAVPNLAWYSRMLDVQIHGGSNAIVMDPEAPDVPYFLAAIHTVSSTKEYVNYLLKFTLTPPYSILAVSYALPLIARVATCPIFASGLTLASDKAAVLVSYGSCDEEPRVLSISPTSLATLFDHSMPSTVSDDDESVARS